MSLKDKVQRGLQNYEKKIDNYNQQKEREEKLISAYQRRASRIDNDREVYEKFKNSRFEEREGYARELENRGYKRIKK